MQARLGSYVSMLYLISDEGTDICRMNLVDPVMIIVVYRSVVVPEPVGSETFGWFRIRILKIQFGFGQLRILNK
jgi:hypothetical protein